MKKILSIFAAALVALAVNATPVEPGAGTLKAAISAADAGAVIELATGVFEEESAIGLGKNLTIKAADGAVPVIKAVGFGIQGGATVTFEGIKFDASTTASHLIYANDATAGNQLICEGCEFYNYTLNSSLIHVGGSSLLDACTINNCYIHNIKKSFIFNENKTNAFDLTVSNSTIANITTDADSYYAGVIDSRATSGTVRVNQCTFYNVLAMNTDYAAVGKIAASGAIVSNSIFAMPTSTDNLRAIRDVSAANNCLTYNYTKDSNRGIHSDVAKNNCIFGQDPLFADAAKNDYTLDEENSPAKGAGQGGTHLGDPRWWPASWKPAEIIDVTSVALDAAELAIDVNETAFLHATVLPNDATDPSVTWTSSDKAVATVVDGAVKGIAAGTATITAKAGDKTATCVVTVSDAIPSTDFAAPYFLKGTKAVLDGNIYLSEADSLHYKDKSVCGTATWKINALTSGVIKATANYKEGSSSGAKLRIVILDKDENQVGDSLTHEYYSKDGDVELSGSIILPKAGEYTVKLVNIQSWSSAKLKGITLTKIDDVRALYLNPGVWAEANPKYAIWCFDGTQSDTWSDFMVLADGETDIYTTMIPAGYETVTFARFSSEAAAPEWNDDIKWNQTQNMTIEAGKSQCTIKDWSYGEWAKYGLKFKISGSMTDWSPTIESFENSYTLHLEAGSHQFKVVNLESAWLGYSNLTEEYRAPEIYPDQDGNVCFVLDAEGDVVVTYIKDNVFKVEGSFVPAPVKIIGINGWTEATDAIAFTPEEDHLTTSATIYLEGWYYEFKMIVGGAWLGKENEDGLYGLHREWTKVSGLTYEGKNIKLTMDDKDLVPGNYKFTWTYATGELNVTFPDKETTALDNTNADAKVIKTIENGQLVIIKDGIRYNAQGAVVK